MTETLADCVSQKYRIGGPGVRLVLAAAGHVQPISSHDFAQRVRLAKPLLAPMWLPKIPQSAISRTAAGIASTFSSSTTGTTSRVGSFSLVRLLVR